jgi:hypothetical protein
MPPTTHERPEPSPGVTYYRLLITTMLNRGGTCLFRRLHRGSAATSRRTPEAGAGKADHGTVALPLTS